MQTLNPSATTLPDWGKLKPGFIINGKYQVVKLIQQGVGGSVYIVKKYHSQENSKKIVITQDSLDQDSSEEKPVSRNSQEEVKKTYVMKIFISEKEMFYFQTECHNFLPRIGNGHMNVVRPIMVDLFTYSYSLKIESSKQYEGVLTRNRLKQKISQQTYQTQEISQQVAYIVYDFCERDDLFSYVKHGQTRFNNNLSHAIFVQVLRGLDYFHNNCQLSHLDVKLENIVFDKKYVAKLIDFSFCTQKDAVIYEPRGTEQYAAPEVIEAQRVNQHYKRKSCVHNGDESQDQYMVGYMGEQADIFSLGILLFTMYFGNQPFKGNSYQDEFFKRTLAQAYKNSAYGEKFFSEFILTAHANNKNAIPQDLKNLLAKLLCYEPSQRHSVRDILLKDRWVNNPDYLMEYESYYNEMNCYYFVNNGLIQPQTQANPQEEKDEEILKAVTPQKEDCNTQISNSHENCDDYGDNDALMNSQ